MRAIPPLAIEETARSVSTGGIESDWPNDIEPTLAPSYSLRFLTMPVPSPGKSIPVLVPMPKFSITPLAKSLAPIFSPTSAMPVLEERRMISRTVMFMV